MLRRKDIRSGKCYVNKSRTIARVVLQASDEIVTFHTYHLDTGNSCGSPSECTMRDFTRWANSEVSPPEVVHEQ
jgi:hypothetical protein